MEVLATLVRSPSRLLWVPGTPIFGDTQIYLTPVFIAWACISFSGWSSLMQCAIRVRRPFTQPQRVCLCEQIVAILSNLLFPLLFQLYIVLCTKTTKTTPVESSLFFAQNSKEEGGGGGGGRIYDSIHVLFYLISIYIAVLYLDNFHIVWF